MEPLKGGAEKLEFNPSPLLPLSEIFGLEGFDSDVMMDIMQSSELQPVSDQQQHYQTATQSQQLSGSTDKVDPDEEWKQRRRESKRKCVAKKKAQMANTEKELERATAERDRLLHENRELMYHSQALHALHEYTHDLLESMKGKLYAAGSQIANWSIETYRKNFLVLENYIMNNVTLPDAFVKHVVHRQNAENIDANREKVATKYKLLLEEYEATFDEIRQSQIEQKLARILKFSGRFWRVMANERPTLLASYFGQNLLPPGAATDRYPGINPMLYPALEVVTLSSKKRAQLMDAYQSYTAQVAIARGDVRQVQTELNNTINSSWSTIHPNERTLEKAATGYLATTDAATVLDNHARAEVLPTVEYLIALVPIFKATELSKLASILSPYILDPVQFTELLLNAPAAALTTGSDASAGTT